MSWGERSCKQPCRAKACDPGTCNVDCPEYIWDGSTPPDSKPQAPEPPKIMSIFKRHKPQLVDAQTQDQQETKQKMFWRRMMVDLASLRQEIDRVVFGKYPPTENNEITVTLPDHVNPDNLNVGSLYEVGHYEIDSEGRIGQRKLLKLTKNPDGTTTLLFGKPKK